MKSLLVIGLIAAAESVFAAGSCQNIDLRPQLGPVLNQDGAGYCYAYTAADLVSHKLGKQVSAVDIALQYTKRHDQLMYNKEGNRYLNKVSKERDNDIKEGGWVRYALPYAAEAGFCAEEKVNSNDFSTDKDLAKGLVNMNQLALKQYNLDTADGAECVQFAKIQNVFPGVSMREMQEVANRSNVMNIGTNLADVACEPRIKPEPALKFRNIYGSDRSTGVISASEFSQMDSVLNSGKPLSLTLSMESLYEFRNARVKRQPIHAITLAGRQYNPRTGKCEYILKNSWGPECDSKYKVRCENGYMFVPEEVLRKLIMQADYIE